VLGVGDDAAILRPTPGRTCMFLSTCWWKGGIFCRCQPAGLGHKTLAVNLSDMAAMGAKPRWAFLSLACRSWTKPGRAISAVACLRWPSSMAWSWPVATPRAGR
jgi:thiamine monophosphate kinase